LAGFGKVWLKLAFFFPAEGSSQLRYHEGAWISPLAAFGLNDTYGCSSPGNPSPTASTEDLPRRGGVSPPGTAVLRNGEPVPCGINGGSTP